jgi:hypothetical protein
MTTCIVTITRSREWLYREQLARGVNLTRTVDVPVDVSALSLDARRVLYRDGYPSQFRGYFTRSYQWASSWEREYGEIPVAVDADAPTVGQVDAALVQAQRDLDAARDAAAAEARQREEAEQALAAEWAALPLAQRASESGVCHCVPMDAPADYRGPLATSGGARYPSEVLKRHAAGAWKEASEESARLREIAAGRQAVADRKVLADFLAEVPEDALRGTLKRLANSPETVAALRERIEAASPVAIFTDGSED